MVMKLCGEKLTQGNKGGLKQFNIFLLAPDMGTLCPASVGTKPRMHLDWV